MDYNIEFAKKVLEEMKKPENKFCGICNVMSDCRDAITTNKIWNTINFIKSQFPEETYELVYDEKANPIGFRLSTTECYHFVNQSERINFLRKIVRILNSLEKQNVLIVSENEQEETKIEKSTEVKVKETFFQKVKQFLNKLIKWQ